MLAYSEVYLRCSQLANASHYMHLRGPITLRHLHFSLTELRGTFRVNSV